MKYDVFISYSSKDQKIAEGICGYLESNGYRCFVAYRDIPRGVIWAGAIADAIDESQMMVVVFSKDFNLSSQTNREIELAAENKIPILTYRITDAKFTGAKKYYLKNLNWIDAFPNPEDYFGYLLDSISKLIPLQLPPKDNDYFSDCLNKKNDEKVRCAVHNNIITLNITEGFNIVLKKDYENNIFIGNIPVRELLDFATTSGNEKAKTTTYLTNSLLGVGGALGILAIPTIMMALLSYKTIKNDKNKEIEEKAFNAIISEVNNRYNILLEKVTDDMKLIVKRKDLTDFAVFLDLSRIENSNKSILDKLIKIKNNNTP